MAESPGPPPAGPYRSASLPPAPEPEREVPPALVRRVRKPGHDEKVGWILLLAGGAWPALPFMALYRWRRSVRNMALLARGRITEGHLVRERTTPIRGPNGRAHELTFDYRDHQETIHRLVVRTHNHERLRARGRYQLAFLPERPHRAVLLVDLPGHPELRADGTLAHEDE